MAVNRLTAPFWALPLFLAACAVSGPTTGSITSSSNATSVSTRADEPYALVEVNNANATLVSRAVHQAPNFFANRPAMPVVIGTGDTVQISIVSTSETGFLNFGGASVSPISSTDLPPQRVREGGTINVPPLGHVLARDKTLASFENFLEAKLSEVLVDPSVIVQLLDRQSARVTVVGEVGAPGRLSLNEADTRLLDMISAAGGPRTRSEDLLVKLTREGHHRTVPLDTLLQNSSFNIYAQPDDVISVERPSKKLIVLGMAGANQTVRLSEPRATLADALGQVGGLEKRRAALKGVFLYRLVERDVVQSLGVDISHIPGQTVPTVFRFDFTKPTALFVADAFEIAEGDILYASDSVAEKINAFFSTATTFVPTPAAAIGPALVNN